MLMKKWSPRDTFEKSKLRKKRTNLFHTLQDCHVDLQGMFWRIPHQIEIVMLVLLLYFTICFVVTFIVKFYGYYHLSWWYNLLKRCRVKFFFPVRSKSFLKNFPYSIWTCFSGRAPFLLHRPRREVSSSFESLRLFRSLLQLLLKKISAIARWLSILLSHQDIALA